MRFHPIILSAALLLGCNAPVDMELDLKVYQTSSKGDKLTEKTSFEILGEELDSITINPAKKFQSIEGFGGAFTESSAYLLNEMSDEKSDEIIRAYFSEEGANYSLTRTHMNSCDFSLDHYSYAPVEGDTNLENFSIEPDMDDIIPMIKDAQVASADGFKILASPWTAPPWMKDNKTWNGGKLLPEYRSAWAKFFAKYHNAYAEQGIDIWGFTVENEPLGNDENWESMHYTPEETAEFVSEFLGPELEAASIDAKILVYDQNRGEELEEWADVLLNDAKALPYIYGIAVHWYTSTVDWMAPSLQFTHDQAPDKHIIHTEGCIDAEVPHWREDDWYWQKEATDWGWDWAKPEDKPNHPKYVPVYRYARDIIGCMNNWVEGWIDWNMILDRQGGPNLAKNWCIAPVIVDPELDEVYYTPLYYALSHFSKYFRPGGVVIESNGSDNGELMHAAVQNPDGSIALVVLNMSEKSKNLSIKLGEKNSVIAIDAEAIQTIIINQ